MPSDLDQLLDMGFEKARAEIDRVVGPERLPDFSDEEQLPYFMACLKETMRLRPATPLGTHTKHV